MMNHEAKSQIVGFQMHFCTWQSRNRLSDRSASNIIGSGVRTEAHFYLRSIHSIICFVVVLKKAPLFFMEHFSFFNNMTRAADWHLPQQEVPFCTLHQGHDLLSNSLVAIHLLNLLLCVRLRAETGENGLCKGRSLILTGRASVRSVFFSQGCYV